MCIYVCAHTFMNTVCACIHTCLHAFMHMCVYTVLIHMCVYTVHARVVYIKYYIPLYIMFFLHNLYTLSIQVCVSYSI